jgi:hypothetical protein
VLLAKQYAAGEAAIDRFSIAHVAVHGKSKLIAVAAFPFN